MFTRHVVMKIKPDSAAEFTRIIEDQVIPQLRGQEGCRHVDCSVVPALSEAVLNSYWDTEGYAAAYNGKANPEGLKSLAEVTDGVPEVEAFHISSATFHSITAKRRRAYRDLQTRRV